MAPSSISVKIIFRDAGLSGIDAILPDGSPSGTGC